MAIDPQVVLQFLRKNGPSVQTELCYHLSISQPTFSRLVGRVKESLLIFGRGKNTQYALKRDVSGVGDHVALYEIDLKGKARFFGKLFSIEPKQYYFESQVESIKSQMFEDLPFFLQDLRPQGFLGRLIPQTLPELNAPQNILHWNADDCLRYFSQYGWNLVGNLIVGEQAFKRNLEFLHHQEGFVLKNRRHRTYPQMARQIVEQGPAGSSAAGEQPKFLTVIKRGSAINPVLVKFTPPLKDPENRRWGDLLVCEFIAHRILKNYKITTLDSEIISADKRLFLETKRFDREGIKGRRGVISLATMSMAFTGELDSWSEMGKALLQQRIISQEIFNKIQWLEVFGNLIANTDRHGGNLSFLVENLEVKDLAPVYDMLPMLYRPELGQVIDRNFNPQLPSPKEISVWPTAYKAACDFWRLVQKGEYITNGFKKIAKENLEILLKLENISDLLP